MFQSRMASAENAYYKAVGIDLFNSTNPQRTAAATEDDLYTTIGAMSTKFYTQIYMFSYTPFTENCVLVSDTVVAKNKTTTQCRISELRVRKLNIGKLIMFFQNLLPS